MKQIHKLKIEPQYLKAKLAGDKLFEIRRNDRGYQKGDIVIYKENDVLSTEEYQFEITYVCTYAQKEGWCVFGERRIDEKTLG